MTLNEVKQYISERATYWIDLYNKCPINDRNESTADFAKGSYMACLEMKRQVEEMINEID